jgi:hypothetical protein
MSGRFTRLETPPPPEGIDGEHWKLLYSRAARIHPINNALALTAHLADTTRPYTGRPA